MFINKHDKSPYNNRLDWTRYNLRQSAEALDQMMTEEPTSKEIPTEQFAEHALHVLDSFFTKAKSKDEFEYACALLRISGMECPGWDPLKETHLLIADMLGLMGGPLREDTKIRLALLTYCHLVEVDAIYGILKNMLRVLQNERCSIEPLWEQYRSKKKGRKSRLEGVIPPSAKAVIKDIQQHALKLGENDTAGLLEQIFDDEVRNSFFHSDYILYQDEFRSREGRFRKGNIISSSMKISDLIDLVNRTLGFYRAFMECYQKHIRSYTEPKVVPGRILNDQSVRVRITLLADPHRGLYGFESKLTDIVEENQARTHDERNPV